MPIEYVYTKSLSFLTERALVLVRIKAFNRRVIIVGYYIGRNCVPLTISLYSSTRVRCSSTNPVGVEFQFIINVTRISAFSIYMNNSLSSITASRKDSILNVISASQLRALKSFCAAANLAFEHVNHLLSGKNLALYNLILS